jgi:hypothetical protein
MICSNFRLLRSSKTIIDRGLLVGMLDIVLNKEVKTLEFRDSEFHCDSEIWPLVLKKCTGLQR